MKSLKNKIARMGRRFPITSAVAGSRRPQYPRESCNIASITGVFVRNQIPIFTSWKQHINTPAHFEGLLHMLHVSHVSPLHGKHYRVALTHAFLAWFKYISLLYRSMPLYTYCLKFCTPYVFMNGRVIMLSNNGQHWTSSTNVPKK